MIKVRIGDFEKDLSDVREAWINEQLSCRRRERQSICVQVTVHKPPLHMVLSTPGCAAGGSGRPPNSQEKRILELWEKHRLKFTRIASYWSQTANDGTHSSHPISKEFYPSTMKTA